MSTNERTIAHKPRTVWQRVQRVIGLANGDRPNLFWWAFVVFMGTYALVNVVMTVRGMGSWK